MDLLCLKYGRACLLVALQHIDYLAGFVNALPDPGINSPVNSNQHHYVEKDENIGQPLWKFPCQAAI